MCYALVGNGCPRCGSRRIVKYGRRNGRQQYRCARKRCGIQFFNRMESFGQRFSAEVIGTAIELHLSGKSYKKIAADVERLFSISDTRISGSTVPHWVEKYVDFAVEEVPKPPLGRIGMIGVEYASLHPVEGGCWIVQDLKTSCVLAAQASRMFDPATATEVIDGFLASTGRQIDEDCYFTFGTDEEFGKSEEFPDILEAIKRQFPSGEYVPPGEIPPEYSLLLGSGGAFWEPLQTMRKRKAFRSLKSRQRFLDGWVVIHNHFTLGLRTDVYSEKSEGSPNILEATRQRIPYIPPQEISPEHSFFLAPGGSLWRPLPILGKRKPLRSRESKSEIPDRRLAEIHDSFCFCDRDMSWLSETWEFFKRCHIWVFVIRLWLLYRNATKKIL